MLFAEAKSPMTTVASPSVVKYRRLAVRDVALESRGRRASQLPMAIYPEPFARMTNDVQSQLRNQGSTRLRSQAGLVVR